MKVSDAKKIYTFTCADCKIEKTHKIEGGCGGVGYAVREDGSKICYLCCATHDKKHMTETGRITLYLTGDLETGGRFTPTEISNWPGTLKFNVLSWRLGGHNWNIPRYNVWFIGPDRRIWYGVHSGYNSQLIHCKQTKHTGYSGDLARRYGLSLESE